MPGGLARAAAQRQAPDWERALAVQEDNKLRGLLAELLNQLREEFRDETLDDSLVLDLGGAAVAQPDRGKMAEMMERMRQAHPVLTHDVIGHWASGPSNFVWDRQNPANSKGPGPGMLVNQNLNRQTTSRKPRTR